MRQAGFRLVRYADFVILTPRLWAPRATDALVRRVLADIGLEVAEAKSGIKRVTDGFEFLGFSSFKREAPSAPTPCPDVNTGRKLTHFQRSKTDPPSGFHEHSRCQSVGCEEPSDPVARRSVAERPGSRPEQSFRTGCSSHLASSASRTSSGCSASRPPEGAVRGDPDAVPQVRI